MVHCFVPTGRGILHVGRSPVHPTTVSGLSDLDRCLPGEGRIPCHYGGLGVPVGGVRRGLPDTGARFRGRGEGSAP
jgi:hypothetical protein